MSTLEKTKQTEKVTEKGYYDHCLRCGRRLVDIKSRELGYGVICYAKKQAETKNFLF